MPLEATSVLPPSTAMLFICCTVFAHRLSILYSVALLLSLLSARGIMVKVAEKLVELAVELSDHSPKSMDSTSPFVRLTCEPAILPESSISPIQMLSSVLLTVLLEVVTLLLLLLDVVFAAE